jgi:hypothetical protein
MTKQEAIAKIELQLTEMLGTAWKTQRELPPGYRKRKLPRKLKKANKKAGILMCYVSIQLEVPPFILPTIGFTDVAVRAPSPDET